MGDKIEARKTAIANNVPVIPGTESPVKSLDEVTIGKYFLNSFRFILKWQMKLKRASYLGQHKSNNSNFQCSFFTIFV